ncbi:MAG: hypothetical protein ACOYMP_14625 [Nodosilinea sp.]
MDYSLPFSRPSQTYVPLILHLLLWGVVASTVLAFLPLNNEFLNPSGWYSPEYYKLKENINGVSPLLRGLKDGLALLLLVGSLGFKPTNPNQRLQHNGDLKLLYRVGLLLLTIALLRALTTPLSLAQIFTTLRPLIISAAIFVFCYRHLDPTYLRWLLEALNPLALLQVYYAYRQRNNSVDWHGVSFWSHGAVRSVGTFAEPNSLGLFLALVAYLNISVLPPHPLRYVLVIAYAATTIYFADSRTAALVIAIVLTLELYRHFSRLERLLRNPLVIGFILGPLMLGFSYWLLGQVNASSVRGGMSDASGGRFEAVVGAINSSGPISILVGKYLGAGSNILQVLNQADSRDATDLILSDSTLAALINQVGLLGLMVFVGILYILLRLPTRGLPLPGPEDRHQPAPLRQERVGVAAILLVVGLTSVIFEMYAIWPILVPLIFPWRWAEKPVA